METMHTVVRKFNTLLSTTSNVMKGETSKNPEKQILEIKTADQLRHLMREVEAGEGRINQLLNIGKESLKFDFSNIDSGMQTMLMMRRYRKSEDSISDFFSDTNNPNWNTLLSELRAAGVVSDSPTEAGKFVLNDFNKIEIIKEDGWKGTNEEALLQSIIGILGAKGNKSLGKSTSDVPIEVHAEQIRRLDNYLQSNKIVTQKELLDLVRVNITQGIFRKTMEGTKISGSDIAVLTQLGALKSPLVKYSTLADGGVGFTISKIDVVGDKNNRGYYAKWAKEYNEFVDQIITRGTGKKGSQFIQLDDPVTLLDPKTDLRVLKSIIKRTEAEQSQKATEFIFDMVKGLDPQDNLRSGVIQYLNKAEQTDDLLNFLIGEGLVTTKAKKDAISYVLKKDTFSNNVTRKIISEWLKKYGVHLSDIDAMTTAVNLEIENFIGARHKGHEGTFTQQKFFDNYFPTPGIASRFPDAESQDKFLRQSIFTQAGRIRQDAHDSVINKMEVKVGDTLVKGDQLKTQHPDKYAEVLDDVQRLIALRANTVSVPILSVHSGKVLSNTKNMQTNPYLNMLDNLDIPYVLVDGQMYGMMVTDKDINARHINVLDLDSPHSSAGFNKDQNYQAIKLRDSFYRELENYQWEDGGSKGVALIRMGNAKDVTAVPKSAFNKVADVFNKKIYEKYYDNATAEGQAKLEGMRNSLEKADTWSAVHEDAMRNIIIEAMVSGKDNNRFMDYVLGSSPELANIGKRFSLYHTPSFKRMNRGVLDSLINNVTAEDARLLAKFGSRDVGFIVWNDEGHASVKARNEQLLRDKGTSWAKMLGSRGDESSFDSISFISKDYKRVLELYYGVSSKGSNVFKPIITSNGDDQLMFAKTVFVYDPDIQQSIFSKNNGLDIMITKSADKMKSSMSPDDWANSGRPDRPVHINKTVDEMEQITDLEISQHLKTIPMENVGVSVIPETEMRARQSYSIPNYMDMGESGEYFDAFYADRLDKILGVNQHSPGVLEKMTKNSLYKRAALLKLKEINPNITLDDLKNTPDGLQGIGDQVRWAALGGDPRAMGESMLTNTIKSQFLDPILSPYSITDAGDLYGGKAVIKQNFKFRDLEPTSRTGTGDDTEINPGEIMLPNHIRDGAINFKGKDLGLRILDKDGKSSDLMEALPGLMKKVFPNYTDSEVKSEINHMMKNFALGELHDYIKFLDPDASIGVITTRYPRTAPNDLAVLKLKGFLDEDEGGTAIVNDYDVLNIFEGDYDVDEVDFFWGMNKGTWNHIDRVKSHWVNTKDPSFYEGTLPDLSLMNSGLNNESWNQFDANNRVFKRGIGVVQKTIRLVNHVANLGSKSSDGARTNGRTKGMNELMNYKGADGNEYTIAADYNNADFFARTGLESQLIIDYWKGVSKKILNKVVTWRNDYLFPVMDKSIGKEDITEESLAARQTARAIGDDTKGPETDRIRIFRKFDNNGNEVDLSELDINMIQTLMSKHSKLLTLGTEVYDGTGQSSPATYENIMSISNEYFNGHMNDITREVYRRARSKYSKHEDFESIFGTKHKVKYKSLQKLNKTFKKDDKQKLQAEIQSEMQVIKPDVQGEHTYTTNQRSPFLDGVIRNGKATAESRGDHGSVVERIYREILHRDPLGADGKGGKSDVLLQGDQYDEMVVAASEIMNVDRSFGKNPVEEMKAILPKLIKDVNEDVKQIKYLKRIIKQLSRNTDLPWKTREKRIKAMEEIVKQREFKIQEYLDTKYLEKGDIKYLKTLKMVYITQDAEMEEATIQWYTLHHLAERFRPESNLRGFHEHVSDARKLSAQLYSEFTDAGYSAKYGGRSMPDQDQMARRSSPHHELKDVEDEIMEKLLDGYKQWGMSYLFEYAMPTRDDGTVIGIFNGNPMPVSTKSSGRFKRSIRALFRAHDAEVNKQEKQGIKEAIELMAHRYTAYRNYFDQNIGLIPLKDQEIFGMLNNVPGFNSKIKGTFDRYETINMEKGIFSRDIFGMGPEYDHNISFFRKMMEDSFGSNVVNRYDKLTEALSYTNQLAMENNYMNPVSYYLMTENIRSEMTALGLDKVYTHGTVDGNTDPLSPYNLSPEMKLIQGNNGGVTIKPNALLSDYRLNMLRKIIKQGVDIKKNQKQGDDWSQLRREWEQAGC